jgi:hypothetical protein
MKMNDLADIRLQSEHINLPWAVPFTMRQIPGAELAWTNGRLPYAGGDAALLDDFAWQVPLWSSDVPEATASKTFYAERYGGSGIHKNGGGVRAALSGDWLVKAIGINILSGYTDEQAAERYNGRSRIVDIMIEAVWGEAIHYALPYGAVRYNCIITDGGQVRDSKSALGVREFAWRPAHFMRAPHFRPREENRTLIPSDVERVKEAIARLPDMLPKPSNRSEEDLTKLSPLNRLFVGLDEMVRRFAEQMATAKAKRIPHGTITPSNICLDGRWIDLQSLTALPGYGTMKITNPFWTEYLSLGETLNYLCFYIWKYFPAAYDLKPEDMPTPDWLNGLYLRYFDDAQDKRFVALCGFPQVVADKVWAESHGKLAMKSLANTLYTIARSGHSARRPYHGHPDGQSDFGDYDLGLILSATAYVFQKNAGYSNAEIAKILNVKLTPIFADTRLRQQFIQRYLALAKLMYAESSKQGVGDAALARLLTINSRKASLDNQFLYRDVMMNQVLGMVDDYPDMRVFRQHAEDLIDSVSDQARLLYQDPITLTTLIWCQSANVINYDAMQDILKISLNGIEHVVERETVFNPSLAPLADDVQQLINAMKVYWRGEIEEILK